jgi:prepilin-type N-terminal cleavage/methylation domain-containing protein
LKTIAKQTKKAFTLIELMVAIVISLILLNFVFSYQFNFFKELNYLKSKDILSYESFILSELIVRGFNGQNGLITNNSDIKSKISFDDKYLKIGNYTYKKIFVKLANIDDMIKKTRQQENNAECNIHLVTIKPYTKQDISYSSYQRLVYQK